MSQQVFADRLGKSKSWVDKIERGVRRLDKVSVLREIATVLRVDVTQLTGQSDASDGPASGRMAEAIRAALTRHDAYLGRRPETVPDPDQLEASVNHAWMALASASYDSLLAAVPGLITDAHWCRADHQAINATDGRGWRASVLLGQVYQIAAEMLLRLGEHDLAWIAADRAVAICADAGDPLWAARAAVPLASVARETGSTRYGFEVCIVSAHRIAGPDPLDGATEYISVYGTLLLHAAHAAAVLRQHASVQELLDQATAAAQQIRRTPDPYHTHFGPGMVDVTAVTAFVALDQPNDALRRLSRITDDPEHQRLPPAVRASHQIEAARVHLQVDDPTAAGWAVLAADKIAPSEVRARPDARAVLGDVLRRSRRPERTVTRLAEAIGVTL